MNQRLMHGQLRRGWQWILLGVLAWLWGTGCGRQDRPASRDRDQPPAPPVSATDEPLVVDAPLTEADRAWHDFQESTQTPDPPDAWLVEKPSPDEVAAFKLKVADQLADSAGKANDFYTRFPEHEAAQEARRQEIALLNYAAQMGSTNVIARVEKLEGERLADPQVSEDERLELRIQQLQRMLATLNDTNQVKVFGGLESGVRALRKDFPERVEIWGLYLFVANRWLAINEKDKAIALAREVIQSNADPQVSQEAQDLLSRAERLGKPLELNYTAIDGRQVNLQAMKGKVVLVDFWATWCPTCMAEMPHVKEVYEKLHPKGFEIVGINFDEDRAALDRALAREKLPWPQYFETQQVTNRFGEMFGIEGLPTMWLVDKKGVLRDLYAHQELEGKVDRLLAEGSGVGSE